MTKKQPAKKVSKPKKEPAKKATKKEAIEKIPEAPCIEKAAAARKRKGVKPPKPRPKNMLAYADTWSDKDILDVKAAYYDHLAKGFPVTSFHYRCSYKTLQKIIKERPELFPEEEMDMAKSRRYHTMITIGMQQAQGTSERGNAQSWKVLMYNMFGWKDRVEQKAELQIEDQFKAAVRAQNATEQTELEEVRDTEEKDDEWEAR